MKFLILLGVLFLGACASADEAEQTSYSYIAEVYAENIELASYEQELGLQRLSLLLEREYYGGLGLGVYSGIYFGEGMGNISIRDFQEAIGANNAITAQSFYINGEYPRMFVLEAMVASAAPMLNFYGQYNSQSAKRIAENAGVFALPIFLAFNSVDSPNLQEINELLGEYAPNAQLVLNIQPSDLDNLGELLEVLGYIDWLNLNLTTHLDNYGNFNSLHNTISKYHLIFQHHLPLMLSIFIPNHNLNNNTHFAYEASQKMLYIYDLIALYPRINAIIYANKISAQNNQNSLLTNSVLTMQAYRNALNLPHILNSVLDSGSGLVFSKSIFNAYRLGDSFYIPKYGLLYSAMLPQSLFYNMPSTSFAGGKFYNMAKLYNELGLDFFVRNDINSLILRLN